MLYLHLVLSRRGAQSRHPETWHPYSGLNTASSAREFRKYLLIELPGRSDRMESCVGFTRWPPRANCPRAVSVLSERVKAEIIADSPCSGDAPGTPGTYAAGDRKVAYFIPLKPDGQDLALRFTLWQPWPSGHALLLTQCVRQFKALALTQTYSSWKDATC